MIEELRIDAANRLAEAAGHDRATGAPVRFRLDEVAGMADAETGEVADSPVRWLRKRGSASVKAKQGRRVPKPGEAPPESLRAEAEKIRQARAASETPQAEPPRETRE